MQYNFKKKGKETMKSTLSTLADVIPDAVKEVHNIGDSVLAMTSISEGLEMEVFASNIPADEWASELEKCDDGSLEDTGHVLLNENKEETRSEICPQREPQKTVSENLHLDIQDMEYMLNIFKTTKDCNKKEKWNSVTPTELLAYFSSTEKLICFLDVELRAVIRYLKKSKSCKLKEPVAKSMKIQDIASLLGLETTQSSSNVSKNSKVNMRARKSKLILSSLLLQFQKYRNSY